MSRLDHPVLENQEHIGNVSEKTMSKSFELAGLASKDNASPTGMKDEILLVSWLITLLRTREGSNISFDWTHGSTKGPAQKPETRSLSMDKIMTGLQDTVTQIISAISHQATAGASSVRRIKVPVCPRVAVG